MARTISQEEGKKIYQAAKSQGLDANKVMDNLVKKGVILEGVDMAAARSRVGYEIERGGVQGVKQDIVETGQGIKEAFMQGVEDIRDVQADTDKTVRSSTLQQLGGGARAVSGALGETVIGVGKALLPESTERRIEDAFTKTVQNAVETGLVQKAIEGAEALKETAPELYENIRAALSIAELGAEFVGAGAATRGTKKAASVASDVVGETAQKAAETGMAVVQSTPVQAVREVGQDISKGVRSSIEKIPGNIEQKRAARVEFESLPQEGQQAVRLGGDILTQREVRRIVNSNPTSHSEFKKMAEVAEEFEKKGKGFAVSDYVGSKVIEQLDTLKTELKKTGGELEKIADGLDAQVIRPGTLGKPGVKSISQADMLSSILERMKQTKSLKNIDIIDGKVSYKGTQAASDLSKGVRKNIADAMKAVGKLQDAKDIHAFRQELFKKIKPKLLKGELNKVEEEAVEAIRRGLSDVLESIDPKYKELNKKYAQLKGSEEAFSKKFKIDMDADIATEKAGTFLRRLTSNAPTKGDLAQILRDMESSLREAGAEFTSYDFVELQEFANTLNKIYDMQGDTSLAGIIRDTPVSQASQTPGDKFGLVKEAFKKVVPVGDSPENAKKGLRILLEGLNKSKELVE